MSNREKGDFNQETPDVDYALFQGSQDEDNFLGQLGPTQNQRQLLQRENDSYLQVLEKNLNEIGKHPSQQNEGVYDAFRIEGNTPEIKKNQKNQSPKKQMPIEEALLLIEQKLSESTTIESKINGFKLLSQRIRQSYRSQYQTQAICTCLQNIKLVENFFHENSHHQILVSMPTILKFLYENEKIRLEQVIMYTIFGLKSTNDEYVKAVQSLLGFVKIEDLQSVFQMISNETDLESQNLASLLSSIVGNKYYIDENLFTKQKKNKNNTNQILEKEEKEKDEEAVFDSTFQAQEAQNEIDLKQEPIQQLTINLFRFLIQITEKDLELQSKAQPNSHSNPQSSSFYPILSKLISSKHEFLSSELCTTICELLKGHKMVGVWILQHCLKIDFGQSSKMKGSKNQVRLNFIQKLASENLPEYLLINLAKVRFNKAIVDKILNIFILLSKNHKPLEDVYIKFIWKILGLQSREQKQRQQFFNFVRDILRNQSNFTEQSVYFIFFEILMSLKAEWFSLKILDCLQIIFMRLNEDLKLISYVNNTYIIQNPDLVGIDKFWYIYFHSNDLKVTKKCKDFLWKITTYSNVYETKTKLFKEYIQKILHYMSEATSQQKVEFCNKGFDIIDKLMEEAPKKDAVKKEAQTIQLIVKNQCRDAIAPKKIDFILSQKCNFRAMKEQISLLINPSNEAIRLISKGKILKGDKMTLKQLSLQNGQTIMVLDDDQPKKQQKKMSSPQNLQKIVASITQIFGSQFGEGLIKFIAEKMEDQSIEDIMQTIMNDEKFSLITAEFEQSKLKQVQKESSIMQNESQNNQFMVADEGEFDSKRTMEMQNEEREHQAKQVKISLILSTSPEYMRELLLSADECNKKRGWQTIKALPNSDYYLEQIQKHIGQQNWLSLFPQEQPNEMICTYNAHLLKHILQKNKNKIKKYMIENGGFMYLKNWLMKLVSEGSYSNIIVEEVTSLLAILLEEYSSILQQFAKRITNKEQKNLLKLMIEQNVWICKSQKNQVSEFGDIQFIKWLINLMLAQEKVGQFPSSNIAKILIYYILTNNETLFYILQLPLVEIFRIIQMHGFAGEYIFLTTLSKIFIEELDPTKKYSNKLLNLVDYGFDYTSQVNSKANIIYIYDIVSCILDRTDHHREKQIQIISQFILTIMANIDKMQSQQLVSMLALLKVSICKIYGSDKVVNEVQNDSGSANYEHSMQNDMDQNKKEANKEIADEKEKEALQLQVSQFSEWLFKNYLFDLQKPGKYTRDKSFRKQCYEILALIGANCPSIGEMLVDNILKIQIPQRNRDDDYIDFRVQDYLGLKNLGATCYINSLLQQLYHTKFSKLLVEKGTRQNNEQVQNKMPELKKIFTQLCYSIKNVVDPSKFIKSINFYGQPINTSVQQDANEFLLCLFNIIEGEDCREQVHDVFGGYLCNQITVEDSGSDQLVKNNMEHFNTVTIDIKDRKNLQQALAYFIKPQVLDGENKYFCEELGKKMKASRRCYFQNLPNILILTLKRFQFNYEQNLRKKLNDYFQFPFDLDLHKYSASALRNKEESSDSKYKLTGILVHSGSAESGHYYSYIKIGDLWYEFNDKSVSEFNITNNLKNECFGSSDEKKNRNAYILFYEKTQTSYHGVSLNQIPQTNLYKRQISEQNAIFLKTRLIYDENFRKMLEELQYTTKNSMLQQLIVSIFGKKKKKEDLFPINQEIQDGNPIVYFDEEEKQPLMAQDSLFDDLLNRD